MDDYSPDAGVITALAWKRDDAYITFSSGAQLRVPAEAARGLRVGDELCSDALAELLRLSGFHEAKLKGLRMLSMRSMSRYELIRRLCEKGVDERSACDACDFFAELRMMDDGEYAKNAAGAMTRKGYGPRRVKDELRRKGLSREDIEVATESLSEDDGVIDAFLRKKLKSGSPDKNEINRVCNALLRRGFTYEAIKAGLRRYDLDGSDE